MPFGLAAKKPTRFPVSPIYPGTASRRLVPHLAWLFLFGLCTILINPRGYTGGGYDDARYLAAATDWALHGPVLGQTTGRCAGRWCCPQRRSCACSGRTSAG